MMIFLPFSQGASSSASGTRVVLPAPGGATSTAALFAASVLRELVQHRVDRERGVEAAGQSLSSVITRLVRDCALGRVIQ